jgi:hypothetical protein
MKTGIVIITFNIHPEVFLLQVAAIKKFCKDSFDILIIDNSSDAEAAENIRYHSSTQHLRYIKTFAGGHGSSDSHAFAANFAYQKYKDTYDYFLFLDHDAIPVRDFSVIEILSGGHVAAGIGQDKKKKYPWPGAFMLANNAVDKDLVDFSPNPEYGLDTGGNLYLLLEKYGPESFKNLNESYHQNPGFVSKDYGHYAMINDQMFLHFVNGSNWNKKADYTTRINSLINVVKEKAGL